MTTLSAQVWENKKLITETKIAVYHAYIVSTVFTAVSSGPLMLGRRNTCTLSALPHPVHFMDGKVSNNAILERAGISTMYTLLRQHRLRWLGRVCRMGDGRIPKDFLYGELEIGSKPVGRLKLRFGDVCKRDIVATGLPAVNWRLLAEDRVKWKTTRSQALRTGERKLKAEADDSSLSTNSIKIYLWGLWPCLPLTYWIS